MVLISKSLGLTHKPLDIVSCYFFFFQNIFVNSFHHSRDGWFSPSVCLENIFMSASTIDEEALNNNMLISPRRAVSRSTSSSKGESRTQHLRSGVHHLYLTIFVLTLTQMMRFWPQRNELPCTSRWKWKQTHLIECHLHSCMLLDCTFAAFCANLAELHLLVID